MKSAGYSAPDAVSTLFGVMAVMVSFVNSILGW
jgi:hypothetical protein